MSRMSRSTSALLAHQLAALDLPADQVLDERLGDRGVDVVVGHLVAHAVGTPAQGQLGQIAGAEDDRVVEVGQAEQVAGPLAGLHVLERHVVDRLALGERVAQVLEHLQAGGADVDLLGRHAQRLHQLPGVAPWSCRWWRSRASCRRGCSPAAGSSRSIVRQATIRACVESSPPETPITIFLMPLAPQPLLQPGHLDVVRLEAALVPFARIVRHVREPPHRPPQRHRAAAARPARTRTRRRTARRSRYRRDRVVEAVPAACAPGGAGPGRCRR